MTGVPVALQPHQQRVVDERNALNIKWVALIAFSKMPLYASLPEDERADLIEQAAAMKQYLDCLDRRIARWTPA